MHAITTRRRLEGLLFLAAFATSIPAANWMIGNVGTSCAPGGPCQILVAPGLAAPSGVLMVASRSSCATSSSGGSASAGPRAPF